MPDGAGGSRGGIQGPRQPEHLREVPGGRPRAHVCRHLDDDALTLPANLAVAYNEKAAIRLRPRPGRAVTNLYFLSRVIAGRRGKMRVGELLRDEPGGNAAEERYFAGLVEYQASVLRADGESLFAADSFVTSETGTGFVHVAPGHGLDDYNLGRQNGLADLFAGG